ncbi:ABC transporter permease [Paenibacillus odorifer]|uniref:methionine ABC transporter permease n=2 Tax=Paenibacillus TaxID=44249 RepID=UPI00096DABE5|nr:methionine ABC transporter permease [Paenibacillus odorifer]MEC0131050.1 ABC transporter permease [Paenibacillus odorifer]MEC0221469.1 ABC transporter permease [Paenibacillus odorifer]OME25268.1 metal ABC transporter permease [Paenibacillus odorifer]OME28767.1 metal ABC transporter permease [Paenibacillus odorifer]OME34299.1 metal ABC transporter permease [Paenibacillus odorifer]
MNFADLNWQEMIDATVATIKMIFFSGLFTIILGLPLGILLYLWGKSNSIVIRVTYSVLSLLVNILRSVPFIILMVALIPFSKAVVGTSIGVLGTIPPLVIGAAPFFARLVETSLREVDRGVIEAAQGMGASTNQIVMRVLLPEARPGLLAGVTITLVTLVSYTAMAGMVGGGGLGDLAIRYGYHRYETEIMIVSILFIVVLVQLLQMAGDRLVKHYTRK